MARLSYFVADSKREKYHPTTWRVNETWSWRNLIMIIHVDITVFNNWGAYSEIKTNAILFGHRKIK
jgi:hypothetical protein